MSGARLNLHDKNPSTRPHASQENADTIHRGEESRAVRAQRCRTLQPQRKRLGSAESLDARRTARMANLDALATTQSAELVASVI
jgi:hypothetical protein